MSDERTYLKKLEKLEPLLGSQVDSLIATFHQGSSVKERFQAGAIIDLLYQQYCRPSLAEPNVILRPPSEELDGKITLGSIEYRDSSYGQVLINNKDLTRHVGIWGTTGSGKTNLVHILVDQLLANRIPFTIFDWKQNFRSLLRANTRNPVLYFTVGSQSSPFYWNPLVPPPNTQWEDWLKLLIESMKHAFFLGHGVERILQQTFFDLADVAGSDIARVYPTFKSALQRLLAQKALGREAMWIDSARRALGALSFGGISNVFNVPISIGPRLDMPVVYGLENLTDSEKTFFTETLCLWAYFARLNQGERKTLEHVFLIEEAHNILTRQKQAIEDRESLMDGILRQVRELGEGFVIIDQQPSSLTNSALANLNTHFVFNMHNEADIRAICDSIGLHGEDREYLKLLRPGEAVVKVSGIPNPFLANIPRSARNNVRVSDRALSQQMWTYSVSSSFGKCRELAEELIRVIRHGQVIEPENRQNQETPDVSKELNTLQLSFLKSISENPNLSMVDRYNSLGLSAYRGDQVKTQLLQAGLVTQHDVATSAGRISLLGLTRAGQSALGKVDHNAPALMGGPEHEYWKKRVADSLKQKGWQIRTEERVDGKQFDIVIQKGSIQRAVEIETGKGNIDRTLSKGDSRSIEVVVIAATNRDTESQIARKLCKLPLSDRRKLMVTTVQQLCA